MQSPVQTILEKLFPYVALFQLMTQGSNLFPSGGFVILYPLSSDLSFPTGQPQSGKRT